MIILIALTPSCSSSFHSWLQLAASVPCVPLCICPQPTLRYLRYLTASTKIHYPASALFLMVQRSVGLPRFPAGSKPVSSAAPSSHLTVSLQQHSRCSVLCTVAFLLVLSHPVSLLLLHPPHTFNPSSPS